MPWYVERTSWFGDAEVVADDFSTKRAALAKAAELNRAARAVEDPADQIRYRVAEYFVTVRLASDGG